MAPSTSTKPPDEPRRRPKPRGGVESFDEAALLAELEDDQEGTQHAEREETHEELERRLMRDIAAMPDQMALEEAALMRDLASMREEPDEGDVLMAALLAEEEAERRAKEAKARTRTSAPASAALKVPDASEIAALRDACLQEKHEAVRLKRAGDIDGAKAALRRAKDIAARADAAEATQPAARASTPNAASTSSAETIEELTRAVDAARREAVARKRAGDMAAARAALTESKELRAKLEAAVAAAEAAKNADSAPTEPDSAPPEPPPTDVDAMIAEAIGTVVKIISDDPDSKVTARKKKLNRDDDDEAPDRLGRESDEDEGGDEGDDALLRRELGDDYEAQREHWGGDYRHPEPTSERELIASRVEELERLVDSEKRTALARKRGGDHEGARNALRAMKAAQAELADASAMLAALED
ncbi:predicted protein [Micromonas commoda]|uniref:Uncharacterized protein n=1 Tax=Micromonas commoda (strain RCC299 / NOUM17 / CCMP2709) TaxID=296587 RepID=C1EBZ7_MICCC|nr:predicted protein [Micromonas commoda]ACO65503.1 predicted protein [Micromonas commoda]|eukprot:XP_002504245.1 predicted protein [Micromonas commoda]